MHHNNFGNFYTREIYAVPIPTGFIPIPIPIPIMSHMAIPIPMGFLFYVGRSPARESTITVHWVKITIFKLYTRKYIANGW